MKIKKTIYSLVVSIVLLLTFIILIYRIFFGMNVSPEKKNMTIYIPTGSSYEQVLDSLNSNLSVRSIKMLDFFAKQKSYPTLIKPGRYVISKDMSYGHLINMLRSGNQVPVRITFNNIRTLNQVAEKFGRHLESDSAKIINFLLNDSNYISDGFKKENIIALFIPDTYEFFWNTDVRALYSRLLKEYRSFWNDQRLAKAKEKGLDPMEVSILASIIDDEVRKPDEKSRIAGVYLNRLKRGIPLQACPTIKFALNDFTITRVLYKYLQVDSPYNTYKYRGFPPGPIGCPSIEGIDAVLNAEDHDYLYFAAKADFSGYHNFSRTLAEHNHYAAIYQKELNKRKIFK
jgi:UPF0755 protein